MSDDDLEKIRLQKAQDLVWEYDLLREDVDHVIECLDLVIKDIEHPLLRHCRNLLTKSLEGQLDGE